LGIGSPEALSISGPDETPTGELKGQMIRRVWPFILALGVVFIVIGLVRLIA
jgi:hypothetical protein